MLQHEIPISALMFTTLVFGITACATPPEEIQSSYVSHLEYKDHDCDQIATELRRANRRVGSLHASLKEKADKDETQMGVGLILFWPTLFFLEGGDGPEAAEYARLRGEVEALEEAANLKKCKIEPMTINSETTTASGG